MLETLRGTGEPTLAGFSNDEGQRICDKIYSCHSFRRGAETFVRKRRAGITLRGATLDEIYEHARWRRRRKLGSEAIDRHYTDPPLFDRITITMLSQ